MVPDKGPQSIDFFSGLYYDLDIEFVKEHATLNNNNNEWNTLNKVLAEHVRDYDGDIEHLFNFDIIKRLLDLNAEPSNFSSKYNTLNIAILNERSDDCINLLLEHKHNAKPAVNVDEFNTLNFAILEERSDHCIYSLIQKNAEPVMSKNKFNTLNFVISNNGSDYCINLLLTHYHAEPINSSDNFNTLNRAMYNKLSVKYIELLLENNAKPISSSDNFNTINLAIVKKHSLKTIKLLLENNAKPSNSQNKFNTINFAINYDHSLETIKLLLENNAIPSNSKDRFNTAKILYVLYHEKYVDKYRVLQENLIKHCLLNSIQLLLPYDSLDYLFYLGPSMLKLIFASNIYSSHEYIQRLILLMKKFFNVSKINDYMGPYFFGRDRIRDEKYYTVVKYVTLLTNPAKSPELMQFAIELDDICAQHPPRTELKPLIVDNTNLYPDVANIVYEYATEFPQNGFWLKKWYGQKPIVAATATDSAAAVPALAVAVPNLAAATTTEKKYIKYKMKYIALKKKIMNI